MSRRGLGSSNKENSFITFRDFIVLLKCSVDSTDIRLGNRDNASQGGSEADRRRNVIRAITPPAWFLDLAQQNPKFLSVSENSFIP